MIARTSMHGDVALPSLKQLGRRGLPQAIEGGVVPAALFLLANSLAGISVAIVVGFAWTGTAMLRPSCAAAAFRGW